MSNTVYATYLIPESRFENMEKTVKKLARKVENGKTAAEFPPAIEDTRQTMMVWEKGQRTFFDPAKSYSNKAEIVPYLWVTIKYARPVINGWHLLAVYDWEVTDDGNRVCYVSKVPGAMLLPEYHTIEEGRCDHCNQNRRRNKAMLITKDFMDFKVVGSTCIKDFLGHASPNSFIDCYAFEQEIERLTDGSYGGGASLAYYSAQKVMEYAAYFIRNFGYTKASEPCSTASRVAEQLNPSPRTDIIAPTEEDELTAKFAVEWILSIDASGDYISNLHKAIDAGAISGKRVALVASGVYSYQRHLEKVQRDSAPKCNEWLGQIGDRLKGLTATVERVRYSEGYYGTTTIIALRTPVGHSLTWFASGYHEVDTGDVWEFAGTVKKHDEYQGTKQTVLNRVKYSTVQ